MNNRVVFRILSPLIFFVIHVIYLVGWSPDPFLKKWIDGSFTFFLALVLCNIIRARLTAGDESGPADGRDHEDDDRTGASPP